MKLSRTIVIGCAGAGTRLGWGIPKALIEVAGKSLLTRHLENLRDEEDIRIVVGYQAEKVIACAKNFRDDIKIVYNYDYLSTGTGASVTLAAVDANEYILNLDGDLIVHPEDMKIILSYPGEFVSGGKVTTEDPWFVQTMIKEETEYAIGFTKQEGTHEWNGIAQMRKSRLRPGKGHVFQMVEPYLPVPYLSARTREIDTISDYNNVIEAIRNNCMWN